LLSEKELLAHLEGLIDKVRAAELEDQRQENAQGVQDVMDMLDTDRDGLVSKEELFGKTSQTDKQKRSDERMFKFADHNNDGKLDNDEVLLMAMPQYWPNKEEWYAFKAGDHMDVMDTDSDKLVDWNEYDTEMQTVIPAWAHMKENVKEHFDHADKDGNKKLDEKEMEKMVEGMDKGYLQATVQEIMQEGDTSTVDGKLSLNEIITHAKDFGSTIQIFMENPELLFVKGVGAEHHDKFVSRAIKSRGGITTDTFATYGPNRPASHNSQ